MLSAKNLTGGGGGVENTPQSAFKVKVPNGSTVNCTEVLASSIMLVFRKIWPEMFYNVHSKVCSVAKHEQQPNKTISRKHNPLAFLSALTINSFYSNPDGIIPSLSVFAISRCDKISLLFSSSNFNGTKIHSQKTFTCFFCDASAAIPNGHNMYEALFEVVLSQQLARALPW